MNFEVENLAYMLVCLQWQVSGGGRGPGQPRPRMQTGVRAHAAVWHLCAGAGQCALRAWHGAGGGVSSLGVGIRRVHSTRICPPGRGSPPQPLHGTLTPVLSGQGKDPSLHLAERGMTRPGLQGTSSGKGG